jgi:shikimate kinase
LNTEPANPQNLFLIGYRCTGKSSVGKMLAARLKRSFVDTDALLVAERQTSIKEIVESGGWKEFRKLEHAVVKRVCSRSGQVVATGGGVVLNDVNTGLMKDGGMIVWLQAEPETIIGRIMQDKASAAYRPALTRQDLVTEIKETLAAREPVYRKAMDFHIKTDARSIDEICDRILRKFSDSQLGGGTII